MDWIQVWTIVGSNVAALLVSITITITLWLWARGESRADHRQIYDLINAIKDEMKDFHGRLCAIEEGRKKE